MRLVNPLPVDGGEDAAEKATEAKGSIKLNKYVFYCAGWAFCTMLLNNVLNNISLFIASQKLGSTSQAALTSTISLIGGMLNGFVIGGILALVLSVICLAGQFQKHLVQFASEK